MTDENTPKTDREQRGIPADNTPCPPWCDQVQCREICPEDRFHQRGYAALPGVVELSRRDEEEESDTQVTSCEMDLVVYTRANRSDEIWATITLGWRDSGLTVTVETMRRLVRHMDVLLREVGW